MPLKRHRYVAVAVAIMALLAEQCCESQVAIAITVTNTAGVSNPTTGNLTNAIIENARAAMNEWFKYLSISGPCSIEVIVFFNPTPLRGSGRSGTSSFVRTENGTNIFEQSVAAELRTGVDQNGPGYDVEFNFDPTYLRDQIWFDPNPAERTNTVPADRTDSMSFFLHEFGHALAFNGWKDTATGQLPGNYESTFDHVARFDGTNWFFYGTNTMLLWGAKLPLSRVNNNYHHYGNPMGSGAPGINSVLINGLMNGVYFYYGTRYHIGLLDIAMIKDAGVNVLPAFTFSGPTNVTIGMSPAGKPQLTWNAIPLARFAVQYRDSIAPNWQTLTATNTVTNPVGMVRVEDISAPLPAQRFYRVGLSL